MFGPLSKEDTNKTETEWNWELVNEITNEKIVSEKIADHINDYFVSIGREFQATNTPNFGKSLEFLDSFVSLQPDFKFQCISNDQLMKLAKNKISKSYTKDLFDISGVFFYQVMIVLCDHVSFLINNILQSNYYPKTLKQSRLTPLFKNKGDTFDVQNYRPITIVPTISKLIESIMSESILKHLNSNNILSNCQHATDLEDQLQRQHMSLSSVLPLT